MPQIDEYRYHPTDDGIEEESDDLDLSYHISIVTKNFLFLMHSIVSRS